MFEHRHDPLVPRHVFVKRLAYHLFLASIIIGCSLFLGILGYHYFEGLPWLDSLLNASMILSGMGQVDTLRSRAGKMFASGYALFSGVVFITTIGIVIAPILHRFFHRFHLERDKG